MVGKTGKYVIWVKLIENDKTAGWETMLLFLWYGVDGIRLESGNIDLVMGIGGEYLSDYGNYYGKIL